MFQKVKDVLGLGDSFDKLVEKELEKQPLAQLYCNLRSSNVINKNFVLDKMDEYVHLAKDEKAVKTQAFEELETTLLLDIFHIINRRSYAEWDHLGSSILALEEYKFLSDEKRALFRKNLTGLSHKRKTISPTSKQKFNIKERN